MIVLGGGDCRWMKIKLSQSDEEFKGIDVVTNSRADKDYTELMLVRVLLQLKLSGVE